MELNRGKNAGDRGKVLRVIRNRNILLVEGVNLVGIFTNYHKTTQINSNQVKKAQKGNSERKGGFFSKEAPVHYSACALIDPQTKYYFIFGNFPNFSQQYLPIFNSKRSSVKFAYRKSDGEKIRISKKTGLEIVKPPVAFKALPTRKGLFFCCYVNKNEKRD